MPGLLVEDLDIYDYLEVSQEEDDPNGNVIKIRDAVEQMLVHDCNREFGPEQTIIDESYDGPGGHLLFLRRPMKDLTGIKFRYLMETVQDQFFNLDITQYVTWTPGKRRIRSHTYAFPCGYDNVLVSYVASADQPELAKQAVREGTALLYRTRGSEDARSEQMGSFQHVLKRDMKESLAWSRAVDALAIPLLG